MTCPRPGPANCRVAAAHVAWRGEAERGGGGACPAGAGPRIWRGLRPRRSSLALTRLWWGRTCCVTPPQSSLGSPIPNTQRVWREAQTSSGSCSLGSTWPARLLSRELGVGTPGSSRKVRAAAEVYRGPPSASGHFLKTAFLLPYPCRGQGTSEGLGQDLGPSPPPLLCDLRFPAGQTLAGSLPGTPAGSGSMASGECMCASVGGRVSGTEKCMAWMTSGWGSQHSQQT